MGWFRCLCICTRVLSEAMQERGGLPGMVCGDGWLNAVPTAFMISNGLLYLYGQNSAATMLVINMTYVAMGSVVA